MNHIQLSKALCFFLRHKPEALGLELDTDGSALVSDIIDGFAKQGNDIPLELILEAVDKDDKERFFLSEDGLRIRAVQGHSFPVDLNLTPTTPPDILYHGTVTGNLESIFKEGLKGVSRHYVHLTDHIETAKVVGSRYRKHGEVVVLEIDTTKCTEPFYKALNGVWLTATVNQNALAITTK